MNQNLQNDFNNLENLLEKVKIQSINYIKDLNNRPTSTNNRIENFSNLSENGLGTLDALQHFNQKFEPIIVASSGPRYWGYVTGGSTPASIIGDWLTSVYDQNCQNTDGAGDISANIEIETIQLLLNLFELPKDFFGGFVTGATMSSFTCLAVARQWFGKQMNKDLAKDGVSSKLNVLTATPHSSAIKALSMLGIGSNNIIKINKKGGNREAMDMTDFENKINQLNGEPFILLSSGGTVNTVDFDDFEAIAKLKEKYNFWWHIDAAFGGFAVLSSSHKHLVKGWETSDSITIDCHKWLNVPYESAVFFVKQKYNILQVETFQNSNAPYLGNPMEHFDYLNFLPENSRRLKALPVWFSLMAYGKKGIADLVQNNIQNATDFGKFIEKSDCFELLAPVRLNTVCFTISGNKNQNKIGVFLKNLNETGKVFMTPTVYNEKKGIRAAFVNWLTAKKDIEMVAELMKEIVKNL
ncbi:pyridoxal-dependent decarboxylase [Flavobacterium sp.]|uniref:pyridoxal phosphate-dependent decarboxylase family protein n=1 Tax=Flavobacterium sp. TaxID=239 RepID=UPI00286E8372|nr:pyridoxal-dependent decarboxylase [Flavobacterium sp.]